jgi:hypothetical protein
MNRLAWLIAAVIFFFVSSPNLLAAEAPPWGDLSAWVGKYPTNEEAGHIKHLWEEPAVRKSLSTLSESDRSQAARFDFRCRETDREN